MLQISSKHPPLIVAVVVCLAWGLAVEGATIFVKADATGANNGTSWADAFTQVQPALNAAVSNDEVWVAAGTYVENITLKAGVALYGGFAGNEDPATFDLADRDFQAHQTILDGNQAGSVVTSPSGATETTRIDGFTIRNGNGTLSGSYRYGGGIYCSSSSPTIANNTITGNTAAGREAGYGGGIYCNGSSFLTIANNTITENIASGSDSSPYSDAAGGGIHCGGSSFVTIANNAITGNTVSAAGSFGGGICYGSCSSVTIVNNMISRNTAAGRETGYGGGIWCDFSSSMIANNRISGNTARGGGGISCGSSTTIANNTITGNSATCGGGMRCSASTPTMVNTIVAFNSSGVSWCGDASTLTLRYNCVFGNTAYNYNSAITDPTGTNGNISVDPKLADLAYGNMHIRPDSPCVNAGDDAAVEAGWLDIDGQSRIIGSHVDIGADESDGTTWPAGPYVIIRVSPDGNNASDGSSWAAAKRTVQAGINAAAWLGGDVWVRAGIYYERITLHPFAHVYGGFAGTESTRDSRNWAANVTILDGQRGGSVVTCLVGERVSTIDGFTTTNGKAGSGGGIYCAFSSPTVANNTVTANTATGRGGGIHCTGFSSATILNNTIIGNTVLGDNWGFGGGIYCYLSSPTIANNTIKENTASGWRAYGGGVSCELSSPMIASNAITANTVLGDNWGFGGGIYCEGQSSSPMIVNNTITGNVADAPYGYGGGIFCDSSSSPRIADTTIARNVASGSSGSGGGVYSMDSSPTVANTIIAFNSSGIHVYGSSTPVVRSSCVYGNTAYNYRGVTDPAGTNGNISADPFFVGIGDFRLLAGSPCIDAGSNAGVPADALDLDGDGDVTEPIPFDLASHARFMDDPGTADCRWVPDPGTCGTAPIVDMGAYEYTPGYMRGDFDLDGDIDSDDLDVFEACASGPAVAHVLGCAKADFDADGDVDQTDLGLLQPCFSGENQAVDPSCGE